MATMAASLMGSSKPVTADDDTQQFIRGLEMSARKVLTRANKRRMEELRRENLAKRLGASDPDVNLPSKFVIEIPPGVEDWGDQLASKTMEIPSTGMTVGIRATRGQASRYRSLEGRITSGKGKSALPSLGGSSGSSGRGRGLARTLPHISKSVGSLNLGTVSKTRAPPAGGRAGEPARAAVPPTKIDGRLAGSPLFSASMMELTKRPPSAVAAGTHAGDPVAGGGADEEAPGGIANMRVVNASKIIGADGTGLALSVGARANSRKRTGKEAEIEGQGLTSWSSDDLRVKYRAEREREEAYQTFRLEEQVAEALEKDYGQTVAVPEVDRHPLYVAYYAQLERENARCLLRASARNKMKRFITDVHTVWLTNLAHHPEHRALAGGTNVSNEKNGAAGSGQESFNRRGLDGWRDSAAIVASKSQIQSVQPERAFAKAIFFAGRKSSSAHAHAGAPDCVFELENDTDSQESQFRYAGVDAEGGDSPHLPPPPGAAPSLVVLAYERRRDAPISAIAATSTAGNRRRSFGGGSTGGAGGAGSGSNAQIDSYKRMLRVMRFAAPAARAAVTDVEDRNQDILTVDGVVQSTGGGEEARDSARARVALSANPGAETTSTARLGTSAMPSSSGSQSSLWMIASYSPYAGTESRIVLDDEVVIKVVGEAIRGPLSINAAIMAQDGGSSAGGAIDRMSTEGAGEARRCLMLRKGVRVPVVNRDGTPYTSVVSVVEVFSTIAPCKPRTCPAPTQSRGPPAVGDKRLSRTKIAKTADDGIDTHILMLEIIAHPMLSSRCDHNYTGGGGRQRLVLTPDSLWRRRQLAGRLEPRDTAAEELSLGRVNAPRRRIHCDRNEDCVSVEGKRSEVGGPRGGGAVGRKGTGDIEEGDMTGVMSGQGYRQEGGSVENSARGHGENTSQALLDFVEMVAFGSLPEVAAAAAGAVTGGGHPARPPLLLRPPQSFASEEETPPRETTTMRASATKQIPTKKSSAKARTSTKPTTKARIGTTKSGAAFSEAERRDSDKLCGVPVQGGADRLEQESIAEVLLSLVRLGSGQGRDLAISIEGVASSSLREDVGQEPLVDRWQELSDSVEPLSMRVCGRRGHTREVPGTCNTGKLGVTFAYPQAPERTRPVAAFFRDSSISSSDSVMVVVALALDTPRLTPAITAWERGPAIPEAAPDENVLDIIPRFMIQPGLVLKEGLISEMDDRIAPDALLLTAAEKHADYSAQPLAAVLKGGGRGHAGDRGIRGASNKLGGAGVFVAGGEALNRGVNHRRDWKEIDELGFRRFAVYRLLEPDWHMETLAFGVTKRAALPNTSAVCGRSTFHSEQRCTEQLCRQRTASDYSYVSANDRNRGANDPGNYSVSCKHERMKMLSRTGLEIYNAEMAKIALERENLAKDAALQAKVEIGKAQLANRRTREDAAARSLARKADAQVLKVSAGADRARRKWQLRMEDSHAEEVRGSWEKRKDVGGSVFYHSTDDFVVEPFSWDPPAEWDPPEATTANREEQASLSGGARDFGESVEAGAAGSQLVELGSLGLIGETYALGDDSNLATLPRHYTYEERIALAVSRLAENEDLLGALAWRLGIPVRDVRPDGREPALTRGGQQNEDGVDGDRPDEDGEETEENREQIELGESDDASDSDEERGDAREPPGPLPQDHADLRRIRVAKRRRELKDKEGFGYRQPKQSCVPRLPLSEGSRGKGGIPLPPPGLPTVESLEAQIGGLGWRRLARADLGQKFLERVKNPRMQGPARESVNTVPKPRPTVTTDPVRASKRAESFSVPTETMFISDVVEEHARVLHEAERRMKREELLEEDASQEFNAAQFTADGPQEFTTLERRLMTLAESNGRGKEELKTEDSKAKAVTAAKTGNLQDLESLLYEDVPVETKDSNGNTLLLLAAQQANKRIVKFLLRKGATMNHQNLDGNTVLHFCYSSRNHDLGEYLKSKGADDSLLNSEGLTCYEGLRAQAIDNI